MEFNNGYLENIEEEDEGVYGIYEVFLVVVVVLGVVVGIFVREVCYR